MSEQNRFNHESENHNNEQNSQYHERSSSHERELSQAEKEHGTENHTEQIKNTVEQHAKSSEELSTHHEQPVHEAHKEHPAHSYKHLKDVAYSRTMTRTRKQLSKPSQTFSKVIHNKVVDQTSELVGKTIARPSSMFSGAFFAFIGTSLLLWITRYYGYEYNYLVASMMFVIGAVVGVAIEFTVLKLKKH